LHTGAAGQSRNACHRKRLKEAKVEDLEYYDELYEDEEEEAIEEESSNRTFIILVAALGGLLALSLCAFLGWAFIINPRMAQDRTENNHAVELTNQAALAAAEATSEPTATKRVVPTEEPTSVPTDTPRPTPTRKPTNTPVAVSEAEEAEESVTTTPGGADEATPTAQPAPTATPASTAKKGVPQTGIGAWGAGILAVGLMFLLIVVRRVRRAAAAAFYVPGTGLPEAAAVICLVLAIAGLIQLPVNIVGVLLIVVSGVLFIVDIKVQSVAITVGAAVALVLGSVFLFPPAEGVLRLSPWLIGGVTLTSLGFFGATLAAAIRTQRLQAKVTAETIIGATGVMITPPDPTGTVQVQSELWTAIADEPIDAGEEVKIVSLEGLKVRVARLNSTHRRQ
jgi:membrane protein implicated in regulation of membrane protease activity